MEKDSGCKEGMGDTLEAMLKSSYNMVVGDRNYQIPMTRWSKGTQAGIVTVIK